MGKVVVSIVYEYVCHIFVLITSSFSVLKITSENLLQLLFSVYGLKLNFLEDMIMFSNPWYKGTRLGLRVICKCPPFIYHFQYFIRGVQKNLKIGEPDRIELNRAFGLVLWLVYNF